jgi:putative transcriptional regulator
VVPRELKSVRVKFGFTQEKMAKHLCISVSSYSKRENGYLQFTLAEVALLQKMFNMTEKQVWNIFFTKEVALKSTV